MNIQEFPRNAILSSDGTRIAFTRAGNGPALILVHGTGADGARWAGVLPLLVQHFTVYSIDRRGHGASGDAAGYDVQREYADIAAVAGAMEGPVDILGHSFGAACALGAAPQIPNLRRLVLYEPPVLRAQQMPQREELLRRMEGALEAGDREAVVLILMNEMLRIPMAMIEKARATPDWAGQLAAAHTIPRELRSSDAYTADLEALRKITAKTLFLLGGASQESFKVTTETLHGLLPDSQVVVLPDQQHSAMLTAPDLFAKEVISFLQS
ncbi:MAG TPA: alpha/beta hydrolase [Anaerolineaceae bacterium]|nr:alpha/beta hydrolase [Anaerolineaceae bacterium]